MTRACWTRWCARTGTSRRRSSTGRAGSPRGWSIGWPGRRDPLVVLRTPVRVSYAALAGDGSGVGLVTARRAPLRVVPFDAAGLAQAELSIPGADEPAV